MLRTITVAASLAVASGCATARVVGPPVVVPPARVAAPVIVVVEPFFENAPLEYVPQVENAVGWVGYGAPLQVTTVRNVAQKPLFAGIVALEAQHRMVLDEVRRLRPDWRVISTGQLRATEGPVRLVRVIIGANGVVGSDRTLKRVATAFGILIPPLLLVNLTPVHETQRVHGTMSLYGAAAESLRGRLLRYPTQPDFAVDTSGLASTDRPFALDVAYEEGLFADEHARGPILLRGFSERLAAAVVALVEGVR